MTNNGITQVLLHLMTYFPKQYPPDMPQARLDVFKADMLSAYERYDDAKVIDAYKALLSEQRTAPYIADVIAKMKSVIPKPDKGYHPSYRDEERNLWFWHETYDFYGNVISAEYAKAVPNPHSRAVKEMFRARGRLRPGESDPHDLEWYKEHYPQRPEDNTVYRVEDLF